ncbi:MAG: STAS domain-containing protein [Spirochaetes bacterium]|nr:STAS domain-containing protein [Spirochaetota bacterium]
METRILHLVKRQDETFDYDDIVLVIRAVDVMDMDNSEVMSLFLKTMILGGMRKAIVDMEGLEFIDSSGIGVVIETAKLLRHGRGDLALMRVPERIQTIFQPIKLNRFVRIFATEDEAVAFFRLV